MGEEASKFYFFKPPYPFSLSLTLPPNSTTLLHLTQQMFSPCRASPLMNPYLSCRASPLIDPNISCRGIVIEVASVPGGTPEIVRSTLKQDPALRDSSVD